MCTGCMQCAITQRVSPTIWNDGAGQCTTNITIPDWKEGAFFFLPRALVQFCAGSRTLNITIQLYTFCIAWRVTRITFFPGCCFITFLGFLLCVPVFGFLFTLVTSLCPYKEILAPTFFLCFFGVCVRNVMYVCDFFLQLYYIPLFFGLCFFWLFYVTCQDSYSGFGGSGFVSGSIV